MKCRTDHRPPRELGVGGARGCPLRRAAEEPESNRGLLPLPAAPSRTHVGIMAECAPWPAARWHTRRAHIPPCRLALLHSALDSQQLAC